MAENEGNVDMWREVEIKEDDRGEKRLANDEDDRKTQRFEKQQRLDGEGSRYEVDRRSDYRSDGPRNSNVVCHHCGEPGHIRPACPQLGRRVDQPVSVCYNCKKEGHKIVDCPDPRKECKWWPNCPNTNCSYYHPPSKDGAADRRSPPLRRSRSPPRGRSPPLARTGGARSPPRRSRSRERSPRPRSVRSRSRERTSRDHFSPPRSGARASPPRAAQFQQMSIRVSGLPRKLESAELAGLFPGIEVVAGAMIDGANAIVIFKNERDREEALETANKMRFDRL